MTTKLNERQTRLVGMADLGIANIGAGNGVAFALPVGALLLAVGVYTDTAFNSATTATATASDGTTTFVNAADVKTVGAETATGVPKFYPTGGTVTVELAETGAAATAGRAFAYVEYVKLGRGGEIQG